MFFFGIGFEDDINDFSLLFNQVRNFVFKVHEKYT